MLVKRKITLEVPEDLLDRALASSGTRDDDFRPFARLGGLRLAI